MWSSCQAIPGRTGTRVHRMGGVALLGILVACGAGSTEVKDSRERVREETAEAIQAADDYLRAQKERIRGRVAADLEAMEGRIAELRQRAGQSGEAIGEGWKRRLEELEERAGELRRELKSMSGKGQEAWEDFAARASRAAGHIRDGLEEAARELK